MQLAKCFFLSVEQNHVVLKTLYISEKDLHLFEQRSFYFLVNTLYTFQSGICILEHFPPLFLVLCYPYQCTHRTPYPVYPLSPGPFTQPLVFLLVFFILTFFFRNYPLLLYIRSSYFNLGASMNLMNISPFQFFFIFHQCSDIVVFFRGTLYLLYYLPFESLEFFFFFFVTFIVSPSQTTTDPIAHNIFKIFI